MHSPASFVRGRRPASARAESANAILDSFLSDVAHVLDAEKAKDKASAREAWRAWVLEHTECSSGWIHRWTKPQEVWAPSQVERNGEWKGQPTELPAAEADRLHGLWQAVEQPLPPWQCEDDILLPPISGEDVKSAVKTFSHKTSSTYDGMHPKHYGLVGDDALNLFARFFMCVERHGNFPRVLQAMYAGMIPKAAKEKGPRVRAAFRGIHVGPSMYRVWGKARQGIAREWESRHLMESLAHQKGTSILELVFFQGLVSEHAAHCERPLHTANVMYDMENYYEHVNRELAWTRAKTSRFPTTLLAVVLNMYQAKRY